MSEVPASMSEYIGQEKIRKHLLLQLEAAKARKEPVSHFLLSGADRMGKRTLAKVTAKEMGVNCRQIVCTDKLRAGDIAGELTHLRAHGFLLLEQVELITDALLIDILSAAMEDFALDVVTGKGPGAKNLRLHLPHFTVIGISSQPRQIDRRLRRQFLFHHEFEPYSPAEISRFIEMFVSARGQAIIATAANLLADYCGGSLDDIRGLTRKVTDYCTVKAHSDQIDYNIAMSALSFLGYLDRPNSPAHITDTFCKMSGTEFEEFLADLFSKIGYRVEITKASGDHGIDLFLKRNNENIGVQCKRWSNPVGEPIIRDFYGSLLNSEAANGIVVTTTTFTAQARAFAEKKPITLIDIDKLVELVMRYYVKEI